MTTDLWIEDGRTYARFPYDEDLIAAVKLIPGRRWHQTRKAWSVPAEFGDDLRRALGVHVNPGREGGATSADDVDAVVAMFFDVIPEDLQDAVRRALLKVVHPDTGGDAALTVAINNMHAHRRAS